MFTIVIILYINRFFSLLYAVAAMLVLLLVVVLVLVLVVLQMW